MTARARAMDDLAELERRLEAATGPHKECDAALFEALRPAKYEKCYWGGYNGIAKTDTAENKHASGIEHARNCSPNYTASLDAALALVEEKLPEWQIVGFESSWTGPYPAADAKKDNVKARAWLRRTRHSYVTAEAEAATPALALLLALIRALREKGE